MRSQRYVVGNQRGVATTEFVIVSFVFVIIFAAFVMISDAVLFKMKSLMTVRSLAFNMIEQDKGVSFKREVVGAFQTPSMILDKCLSPDLASRPSRIKAQVNLEMPGFFKKLITEPTISDQYLISRDTWKGLSPTVIGALVAACPG